MTMSTTDLLNDSKSIAEAALAYAARGWEIFPAPPGTKQSYYKAKDSNGNAPWGKTRNAQTIKGYWRAHPNANIGVPTGKVSGFWVIEADTPEGHDVDGIASLRQLEDEHGKLPDTLMGVSPSGSLHHLFNHPGGDVYIKNSASELAPGVDVRGDGGMVLVPPSIKPRVGSYRWLNEGTPIADAPAWLIALVVAQTKKNDAAVSKAGTLRRKPAPAPAPASTQLVPVPEWLMSAIANSNGCGVSRNPNDLPPPTDPAKIDAALAVVDAGLGHDDWIAIGCALFKELGAARGHDVFHQWSKRGHNYDGKTFEEQWQSLVRKDGYAWTLGTLFHLANLADADWWRKYQLSSAIEVVHLDEAVEVVRLEDAVEVVR